jgi:outer membrane protein OmpA-like peptidoglycan-associated protein
MVRVCRISLFALFIVVLVKGFSYPASLSLQDSIVKVTGYVYDSLSGDPISNVVITFEELPYGNMIGIIKSKSGGYFEFFTLGHDGYLLDVRADGFETITDKIYPSRENRNGVIVKRYSLVPSAEEGDVINLSHLIFAQGKSEITPESYQELDDLAGMLKENPGMVIQLEGHTDFRGSKTQNLKLSEDRVAAVKSYLVRKGIDSNRILTRAFGGTRPLTREETEEASRLNRRVEVRIVKK